MTLWTHRYTVNARTRPYSRPRTCSLLWQHSSATTGWDRPWSRMWFIAGGQATRKPARANPHTLGSAPSACVRVCSLYTNRLRMDEVWIHETWTGRAEESGLKEPCAPKWFDLKSFYIPIDETHRHNLLMYPPEQVEFRIGKLSRAAGRLEPKTN